MDKIQVKVKYFNHKLKKKAWVRQGAQGEETKIMGPGTRRK